MANDLFLYGNFYGGVTVPKVACAIHQHNQGAEEKILLAGMIINNGITNLKFKLLKSHLEVLLMCKEGRHVQDVDHTSLVEKAAQVLGEILSGGRYEFTDDYTVKKSKKKAGKRQRMI